MIERAKPGPKATGNKAQMVGAYFPPEDRARLKALADRESRSESQMVLLLVREGLSVRENSSA